MRAAFVFAWSAAAVLAIAEVAAAEDTTRPEVPTILVVQVAKEPDAEAREKRFVTDLKLSIDGFSIAEIPSLTSDFVDLSLSRQIALIKPLMHQRRTVAAMWLQAVSKDMLLLQVVVLETERVLVRLFEHALKPGSEEALASVAAELIGTAYLFESGKKEISKPLGDLVKSTRKQAGVAAASPSSWHFHLGVSGRESFVAKEGPGFRIGGFLGIERGLSRNFFLGFFLGGAVGPLGKADSKTESMSGYEVNAQIEAFFGPRLKRFRLGPVLGISGGPETVIVRRDGFSEQRFGAWTLRAGLGIEARAELSEKISLKAETGLTASPVRMKVRLKSTHETLFEDGLLDVWFSLGVLFF